MNDIHKALFALLFFAVPVSALAQTKTVDGASLPRLDLSKPAQHGGLYYYAFSPDGKKVAGLSWIVRTSTNNGSSETSASGEVYLWETRKGGLSKTLGSHDAHPIWLRFTGDGKTIASYSDGDHTLKLWKTTGKKPKAVIKLGGPCGLNSSPRMSTNGETFVHLVHRKLPIGEDGLEAGHELTCWDLKKKKRAWSISAEGPMEALSAEYGVSPDGEKVAVFLRHIEWREEEGGGKGEHGATYHALFDAKTGEEVWRVDFEDRRALSRRPFPGKHVMFTPNGEEVLSVGMSWIRRYSTATGEPIGEKIDLKSDSNTTPRGKSIDNVFFNEEGDRILVERSFGGGLDYYAFPSGKHELSVRFESLAKFAGAAPSGDLRKVAGRVRFDPVVLDLTKVLGK
ncbi:MAG TPA: WD40 repeat domain-containing protein [Planctomycetes bacterium]|nr:WD40 repeat domain-containing protein [Planctomycetota bacterium]